MNIFEYYFIDKEIKEKYIKIKLIQKNKIIDISNMFSECDSLSPLSELSKLNTNNLINMSNIFYNCKSLSSLPDISKWNTDNVRDMSNIFL